MRSHQTARLATPPSAEEARASTSLLKAESARPASAAMESVGATFLPMLAGSMSMCMTRARGAKVASLPVTRSSKRTPTATSRSLSATAMFAAYVPCIPSIPMQSVCAEGKPPSPMRVGVTGSCRRSAKDSNAADAPELTMPPPT